MTREQLADSGHWFSQAQSDRFYENMVEQTGDTDLARKAGRFSASAAGMKQIHQYIMGLLNPETALLALTRIFPLLTRHVTVHAERKGPGKVEVLCTPQPHVAEEAYQCQNRLGALEALPGMFTALLARIDHPQCMHKGDGVCRYIVSWDPTPSMKIKLLRNYALLASLPLLPVLYALTPAGGVAFATLLAALISLNGGLWLAYARLKSKELDKIIETSSAAAGEDQQTMLTNNSNTLMVQRIGQAAAAILDVDELIPQLAAMMHQHLDFDRGLIMLADAARTRLVYAAGYGYSAAEQVYLEKTAFRLDNPESKGFFVRTFLDRKHLIITNAGETADGLSERSRALLKRFGVCALLCIPILFKDTALGILAVDNVTSKTPLKQSDIHLLQGVASQIAISINNARSFQMLLESKNKYRQTLEAIDEGYFELDPQRRIVFANKGFGRMVGRSAQQWQDTLFDSYFATGATAVPAVTATTATAAIGIDHLFRQVQETATPIHFAPLELTGPAGRALNVDLSASLIMDQNNRPAGFRGLLRDATARLKMETERQTLEYRLLQAQRMESLGNLAGQIAHNFNNWLAGILGNLSLIRMDAQDNPKLQPRIAVIERIIDNAARMNRQLLGYARGVVCDLRPTDLNAIVRDVVATFAPTHKEIRIAHLLETGLRTVAADTAQIEQVLWNLFLNARDAMPKGGTFTIATANVTAPKLQKRLANVPPGDYVEVSCTDTGSGIAPEHLEKIFEPFFTTKKGNVTGLGLAASFGIIKAHNGFVDVLSQPGTGTTFHIYLPAATTPVGAVKGRHD
jgi:signal transduction histidine kinase